jgi:hypothetical protein
MLQNDKKTHNYFLFILFSFSTDKYEMKKRKLSTANNEAMAEPVSKSMLILLMAFGGIIPP